MTPTERLQAAIDKLQALKADSTAGEWGFESLPETGESRIHSEADGFSFMAATTVTFYPVPGGVKPKDAELIVTLHRTIDAQLAILEGALGEASLWITEQGEEWRVDVRAVALADAILGSTS